jgi:tetratricopeptide (TPR) repeat protein
MGGMDAPKQDKASAALRESLHAPRNPAWTWGRFALHLTIAILLVVLIAATAVATVRLARGEALTLNEFLIRAQVFWIACLVLALLLTVVVESRQWLFGHFTWIRRAALFGAQKGWRVRCSLRSGWFALLLLYAISATAVALRQAIIGGTVTAKWFFGGAVGPWVQCIGLSALLAAVLEARSRARRIVIAAFSNVTGDDTYRSLADGLPRRLMADLSNIAEVYERVSEDPADLDLDDRAETPALSVDSPTALSGLTASLADQKIAAGFLKIPVDWAINTLSNVIAGPRIIGSIQRTADGLFIEASISGGNYKKTWQVREANVTVDPAAKDPKTAPVDAMIRQLAHQVFTYLDHQRLGTQEWRAADCYTEGLRASLDAKRECEGTGPRTVAVQRAQKFFFQAFREDPRFARSRYNLGVMYYSGRQFRPAYEAFRSVIDDFDHEAVPRLPGTPGFENTREELADVHYAAATAAQGLDENWRGRVLYHCQMAIDLNPSLAAAWNLLGVFELEKADARNSDYRRSSPFFSKALGLSWNELCAETWAGKQRSAVLSRTTMHLANLAKSRLDSRSGREIMKQALELEPTSEGNWVALGKLHLRMGDFAGALAAFEAANCEKDAAAQWLWIACTQKLLGKKVAANAAWDRVQKSLGDELFEKDHVALFWHELERVAQSPRKPWNSSVLDEWKQRTVQLKERVSQLKEAAEQLKKYDANTVNQYIAAILHGKDLKYLIDHGDSDSEGMLLLPGVALGMLNDLGKLPSLERTDPEKIDKVRTVVRKVVDARPTGPLERSILAALYLMLKMPELAEAEVRNALILEPANSEYRLLLANAASMVLLTVTDKDVRKRSIARIVGVFVELALTLTDFRQDTVGAGWAHFYRAVYSLERLDFLAAQQGFETAHACGFQPLGSLQWLCLVHFRCGAFEESEKAYQRLTKMIGEMKPGEPFPPRYSEVKEPRLQQAFAASHSAAAAAEQGLVRFAFDRWRESRRLSRSLQKQKAMSDEDAKSTSVAQFLCLGIVCLSAGRGLAGSTAGTGKRIKTLRRAIFLLEKTVEKSSDSAIRADARYRIAVACAELARLEETNREQWLRLAGEQLQEADVADRREEYKDRIRDLRMNLAPDGKAPARNENLGPSGQIASGC